jgi:hypothetical protein
LPKVEEDDVDQKMYGTYREGKKVDEKKEGKKE